MHARPSTEEVFDLPLWVEAGRSFDEPQLTVVVLQTLGQSAAAGLVA